MCTEERKTRAKACKREKRNCIKVCVRERRREWQRASTKERGKEKEKSTEYFVEHILEYVAGVDAIPLLLHPRTALTRRLVPSAALSQHSQPATPTNSLPTQRIIATFTNFYTFTSSDTPTCLTHTYPHRDIRRSIESKGK